MKVALLQSEIVWEDAQANRDHFESLIRNATDKPDLVVLPEMFTSGFTMQPANVAETMEGPTVDWMRRIAEVHDCAVTGSLVISEGGLYRNRLLFVMPSGETHFYDKRHLFSLAGEDQVYAAGTNRLIVTYRGWRICPLICYDLRFPVFSRNTESYDLLLYAANWPKPRINAWDVFLQARAVENMCYTVGVNRVGTDHNSHQYPGHSQVVDFSGNYALAPQYTEGLYVVALDKPSMLAARQKFGFLDDRDTFELRT